ncbi:hypothetical protein AGABI2DRAFT_227001, partial [Agaricus bisporus var. bisporus H97]|uniref:hypothetical protein n=1 Tax=Agaricus bisporus var. bisporus (strain H97 / ATCC MYA-4626 / FGSC 10389) TaxID=936046 RepID=UPI00029F5862
MEAYDVIKDDYPEDDIIDDYDVVMITGSPSDAFADDEWIVRLVKFVTKVGTEHPGVRLVGICFGHQIICRSLGGEVIRNPCNWETGPTVLRTTYIGRLLYGVKRLQLQEFHQDAVPIQSLSGSLQSGEIYLLASSALTPNQDFKWAEHVHVLTSQGHPEFDERTVTEIHRQRAENDAIAKEAVND